ncbi:MAG: hypothetical protein ACI8TQ_002700 [Planctomycetota bacterium]|jgi:hypothetical protein
MKFPIALLLASLFAPSALAQDGDQVDPNFKAPKVSRITQIERLFRAYGITHGSRQDLKDLKTLNFRILPVDITEEGEREGEPIRVAAQMDGVDRIMRLEEEIEGRKIVKFADGIQEASVFVDNEKREIPELLDGAQTEARIFYVLLDLLYKPESADLKATMGQNRKRDGEMYMTVEYEFHTSRGLPHTYRLFYDQITGLVERVDVHDTRANGNPRLFSMLLSEYGHTAAADEAGNVAMEKAVKLAQEHLDAASTPEAKAQAEAEMVKAKFPARSPQFPARVEFVDRDRATWLLWRLVEVEVNSEFELGYFSEP